MKSKKNVANRMKIELKGDKKFYSLNNPKISFNKEYLNKVEIYLFISRIKYVKLLSNN